MKKTNRRDFLKLSGGVVATTASFGVIGSAAASPASSNSSSVNLPYPKNRIAGLNELKNNTPVYFSYPDDSSPCALLKMGYEVPGGTGPESDIVAYSIQCTHMGCPLSYDESSRDFKCGCHFSVFDTEKSGQMVTGQATENLPKIALSIEENGVHAIGVDGLIFGRQANLL